MQTPSSIDGVSLAFEAPLCVGVVRSTGAWLAHLATGPI